MRFLTAPLLLLLALPSCPVPDPVLENDAGNDAFAQRAMELLWGRRPASLEERDALVHLMGQTDRAAAVRALAGSGEYIDRWQDFVYDALAVNRNGDRSNSLCFRIGYRADAPGLAAFVRDTPSDSLDAADAWTMRDLVRSALVLDDLSPPFRGVLFPNAHMPGVPPNLIEAEADRRDFATVFYSSHLGRTPDCLPCHNSEASVTDSDDPEVDRFWPLPGAVEAALFGASEGRDLDSLGVFFRRHGMAHGFRIDAFPPEPFSPLDLGGGEIPEGFDGCAALENASEAGCDGCLCEERVCDFDPGCCDQSWDEFCAELCVDVLDGDCPFHLAEGASEPHQPWGMHDGCGSFVHPAAVRDDVSGREGWFGGARGTDASAYALEGALRDGFEELRREGMAAPSPSGPAAGARMIAARFVDRVWAEAFGRPLTISHGFPRNEAQRDRLASLSDAFVDGGYSLVDLLVAVTEDPLFNQPLPMDVEGESTYYWPTVVDPWSVEAEDEELRANGLGDAVHRSDPRVLLRSARSALGWRAPEGFPITTASFHGGFQARIGAYITWSEPGFEGIDFQWLSAWESRFAECVEPAWELVGGGCDAAPDRDGCPGCDCFAGVCEERPQCCSGPWDAACAESCRRFNACPVDESRADDWIDGLVAVAEEGEATWEAALVALKARLLTDPTLDDPDERALLAEVVGAGLGDLVADSPDAEAGLRAVCGAMLTSPQFLLKGLPPVAGEVRPSLVAPGESFEDRCALLEPLFAGATCP